MPWGVKRAENIELDKLTFSISLVMIFWRKFLASSPDIKINPRLSDKIIWSFSIFLNIQKSENKIDDTIEFRGSPLFLDPRNKNLGARILSTLEKLHLTVKKLDLKIVKPDTYFAKAHSLGIPIKGIENLKDQLFGLEANFEELNAIDFKKGCYIGQENTARMKLKEKLRRRLLPIYSSEKLNVGEELFYNKVKVGKILIDQPYPFGLIKVVDPNIKEFENTELLANTKKCKILKSV